MKTPKEPEIHKEMTFSTSHSELQVDFFTII